ncbi:MAG: dual specificity protein phosphatase family protein [Myxococcota bacterium]
MLANFSFLDQELLAGSARPGLQGELRADLREAKQRGICAILTLTEQPLDQASLEAEGLDGLHLPVTNFGAPTLVQIQEGVAFLERYTEQQQAVLVHCMAGRGRAGTMLACFLVKQGWPAVSAVDHVRRCRPGSLESAAQVAQVKAYEQMLVEQDAYRV